MTDFPTGDRFVCLDATALIHFAKIGKLNVLENLFPRAFTPEVVMEEEIRPHLAKYPANKRVLEAAWLTTVPIESPATLEQAASIHGTDESQVAVADCTSSCKTEFGRR